MGLGDKALARPASSGRLNGSAACPASAPFVCLADLSARFSFGFRGHDPFVLPPKTTLPGSRPCLSRVEVHVSPIYKKLVKSFPAIAERKKAVPNEALPRYCRFS